jgi:hypothetical protein
MCSALTESTFEQRKDEIMDLQEYFEKHTGSGILATADADGNVDLAVYARPHVKDNSTIGFIMRDRLSHENLQSNPQAAYIFLEEGKGYRGKRLYLTRTSEETSSERIDALRRRTTPDRHPDEDKFLVTFRVDRIRSAVAPKDER